MSTYEEKKKMMPLFPKGTKVLVEIESIKDPKASPFKTVNNNLQQLLIFNNIIGNCIKSDSKRQTEKGRHSRG